HQDAASGNRHCQRRRDRGRGPPVRAQTERLPPTVTRQRRSLRARRPLDRRRLEEYARLTRPSASAPHSPCTVTTSREFTPGALANDEPPSALIHSRENKCANCP